MPLSPQINRRVPNAFFTTAPLHRWLLGESASPHANIGSAASALAISNTGSVGGGSVTRATRAVVADGARFFQSATSDRAVIYTPNPAAGDIVTGTALTFMLWVQYLRLATDQTGAFCKTYDSDLTAFSNPGFQTWGIGINSSFQHQAAVVCGTNGSGTRVGASSGQAVPLGVWQHLAGTYDGANVRLYVNGAEVAKSAQTGNIDNNTAVHSNSGGPYAVGGHPSSNSGGNAFQSSFTAEDAMIFAATVTEAQIREYVQRTVGLFRGA